MKIFNILTALVMLIASTSIHAQTSMEVTIKLAQEKKVSQFIKRVNTVYKEINLAILEKATTAGVSKADIKARIGDADFARYGNGEYSFSISATNIVIFTDLIDAASSSEKEMIKNATNLHPFAVVKDDVSQIRIPLKAETIQFVKSLAQVSANAGIIVSVTAPVVTTKMWYKPEGNGGFEIYSYDGASWKLLTNTKTSNYKVSVVSSDSSLLELMANEGDRAYVVADGKIKNYIYSGSAWVKTTSSISATIATGTCDATQIGSMQFRSDLNALASCVDVDGVATWVKLGTK